MPLRHADTSILRSIWRLCVLRAQRTAQMSASLVCGSGYAHRASCRGGRLDLPRSVGRGTGRGPLEQSSGKRNRCRRNRPARAEQLRVLDLRPTGQRVSDLAPHLFCGNALTGAQRKNPVKLQVVSDSDAVAIRVGVLVTDAESYRDDSGPVPHFRVLASLDFAGLRSAARMRIDRPGLELGARRPYNRAGTQLRCDIFT